ncbi:MAG: hypothetical protein WBX03_06795 [Terriglobales bacterium]
MKIPKTVTPAKAAANKEISKKSSGPKSVQGKRFASRNAIRHGILAGDLLLPGESRAEFDWVREKLFSDLAPVGFRESVQVEIYGANYWRLRRVYHAETGEITKLLCELNPAAELATAEHSRQYLQATSDLKELEKIEEQINLQARVSSENLEWLRKLPYGEPANALVRTIELVPDDESREDSHTGREETSAVTESPEPASAESAATSPEDGGFARDLLLNGVECLKRTIVQEIVYHGQYPVLKVEAKKNALHVPQEAVLNRFTRYEKHCVDKMTEAENKLERMQRLRRGDEVFPPSARGT